MRDARPAHLAVPLDNVHHRMAEEVACARSTFGVKREHAHDDVPQIGRHAPRQGRDALRPQLVGQVVVRLGQMEWRTGGEEPLDGSAFVRSDGQAEEGGNGCGRKTHCKATIS